MSTAIDHLNRSSDWSEVRVTVLGLGIAGYACADSLTFLGATVTAIDAGMSPSLVEKQQILETLGAVVHLNKELFLPVDTDLLVVSPGLPPHHEVIVEALERNIPVWGELELAWRLRESETAAPWLCVTGTNGKTTTTLMLESMLRAAGLVTTAAGNIGRSLVEVVMDDSTNYDVIAVEVGAPQLPFVYSMSPYAAVCLNIAEDHIDHFGSMANYLAAKSRVFANTQVAAVYNISDPLTLAMVEHADVIEGCRAIGFGLVTPDISELGLVEEILVDRAFVENRQTHAQELATIEDVHPQAMHNVANALAAAALARSFGVDATSVREGLIAFEPAPHRMALVATHNGIAFINDSKATNCHAASTALSSTASVVWVAGGDAKGQDFSDLIKKHAQRFKHVILLGRDRQEIKRALESAAPQVAITEIENTDPALAMDEVVAVSLSVATSGDTVLLAPACASWDMYRNYGHRGDEFARAVRDVTQ